MKKGLKDFHQIETDYYEIDSAIINGDMWVLYEHSEYGDEVKAIAVNITKSYYTYTYESLRYTVENLDSEYSSELYSL